jgi:hypothetical protein
MATYNIECDICAKRKNKDTDPPFLGVTRVTPVTNVTDEPISDNGKAPESVCRLCHGTEWRYDKIGDEWTCGTCHPSKLTEMN